MIVFKWLTVIGLLFSLGGVTIFAWGFIIPKLKAVEVGVSRIPGESVEENLKLPSVCDRLRQARRALLGLVLLVIGFLLQIIGNWP